MTCIIDSLFYDLLVHVCLFHALYCELINSEDSGVRARLWIVGQVGMSQIENWDTVPNLNIGPLNNLFFTHFVRYRTIFSQRIRIVGQYLFPG